MLFQSKMTPDGTIIYVNDELVRVSGYSRDKLLGSDFSLLIDPEMNNNINIEISKSIQKKSIWKGVLKNKTATGNDYYVKSTLVPLLDENNELLELISIQHDITQAIQQREQILIQSTDENTGKPNKIKKSEEIDLKSKNILSLLILNN